jgi:hypothetical protein
VCGSVEKAGDSEFFGDPFGEGLPGRECIGEVRSRQWDEGDDVHDAEAGMNAVSVGAEIECLDGATGQSANRLFANEGEHAPMVIGVDMEIEKILAAVRHQAVEYLGVPPFADVRHAFEHVFTLPGGSLQS